MRVKEFPLIFKPNVMTKQSFHKLLLISYNFGCQHIYPTANLDVWGFRNKVCLFFVEGLLQLNNHLVSWYSRNNNIPALVNVYCVTLDWILLVPWGETPKDTAVVQCHCLTPALPSSQVICHVLSHHNTDIFQPLKHVNLTCSPAPL